MTKSFGRKRDQRNHLLRNLAASVILYESVITTEAKGRVVQPIIERLIRIGQNQDKLTARRQLLAYLPDENSVNKILNELVDRFGSQTSGFTRRLRVAPRLGDGAPQVMVQLSKTVLLDAPKPAKEDKKTVSKASQEEAEG